MPVLVCDLSPRIPVGAFCWLGDAVTVALQQLSSAQNTVRVDQARMCVAPSACFMAFLRAGNLGHGDHGRYRTATMMFDALQVADSVFVRNQAPNTS